MIIAPAESTTYDALAAGVDHDAGLLGELLGRLGVGHHQEADRLEPELAGEAEVLDRHVGLGAVGGDPDQADTDVDAGADVVLGADAGQHQRRDLGLGGGLDGGGHEVTLVDQRPAVVVARPAEAVAVGDLDHRHAGGVERADDGAHVLDGELVPLGVGAVAQRRVGHADVEGIGVGHQDTPAGLVVSRCWAIWLPTWVAAAVMMSRLPA